MGIPSFEGRILFLMQESRMAGIEYNSLELACELRKSQGTEVTFLCPKKGTLTNLLDQEGFTYDILPRPTFLSTSSRVGSRYLFNPFTTFYDLVLFFPLIFRIHRWLKRNRPSLVVTKGLLANFYGGLGARLARVPVLWDMQEIVSGRKAFGLMRWFLNQAAFWIPAHITAAAEAIRAQFSRVVQEKITVIPNGISLEHFHPHVDPMPFRKELGIGREIPLVGHVARYTYWKGQMEFVQAAAEVARAKPEARFVLVGAPVFENDVYERQVKKLAQDLKLEKQIFFIGYRADLEQVLAALDIYVHSSIEPEGCPLTLICAMAMEKAVIATSVPGNSEVVQEGINGLLVEPGNPSALAGAITHLLSAPGERNVFGKAARLRVVEKFSLDQFAAKTLELMQRVEKYSSDEAMSFR